MSNLRNYNLVATTNLLQPEPLLQLLQPITTNLELPKTLRQFAAGLCEALAASNTKKIIILLTALLTTLAQQRALVSASGDIAEASMRLIVQIYHDAMVNDEDSDAVATNLNSLSNCLETLLREPTRQLFVDSSQLARLNEIISCIRRLETIMVAVAEDVHRCFALSATPPSLNKVLQQHQTLMTTHQQAMALLDELTTQLPYVPLKTVNVRSKKYIEWMTVFISLQSNQFSTHKTADKHTLPKAFIPLAKILQESITHCENGLQTLITESFTSNMRYRMLESCAVLIGAKHNVMEWDDANSVRLEELLVRFSFLMNADVIDYSNKHVIYALKGVVPFLVLLKAYEMLIPLFEKIYLYLEQHETTPPAIFHSYLTLCENNLVPVMQHSSVSAKLRSEINSVRNKLMVLAYNRYKDDFYNQFFNEVQAMLPLCREPVKLVNLTASAVTAKKVAPRPTAIIPLLADYLQSILDARRLNKFKLFEEYLVSVGSQKGDRFIIQMDKLHPSIPGAPATHAFTQHDLERLVVKSGHPKSILQAHLKQYYAPTVETQLYVPPTEAAASASEPQPTLPAVMPAEEPVIAPSQPNTKMTKNQLRTAAIRAKLKSKPIEPEPAPGETPSPQQTNAMTGCVGPVAVNCAAPPAAETTASTSAEPIAQAEQQPAQVTLPVRAPIQRTISKTIVPPFFAGCAKNTYSLFGGSEQRSFSIMQQAPQAPARSEESNSQPYIANTPLITR